MVGLIPTSQFAPRPCIGFCNYGLQCNYVSAAVFELMVGSLFSSGYFLSFLNI